MSVLRSLKRQKARALGCHHNLLTRACKGVRLYAEEKSDAEKREKPTGEKSRK